MPDAPEPSGLDRALRAVGDRWSLAVVAALLHGPLRYGELQSQLGAVAPNVLAKRLRDLEAEGLLIARRYSARPPRFEYELTERGTDLSDAVAALEAWGRRHGGEDGDDPLAGDDDLIYA